LTTDCVHVANERTFLGYLRTSQICSMIGIFVAQLLRLQHSISPDPTLGFYVVGVPLSAIFQILAILVLLVGTSRYFKHQKTMTLGKALSGGWEILTVGGLSSIVGETVRKNRAADVLIAARSCSLLPC
jgi:uncharacterized membrane protein YidH (DUF202 family)